MIHMGIKATGKNPVSHIKPPLWNRVVDSMLDYERRQLGDAVKSKSGRVSTDCVKVINASGGDLDRGSVLRCNGDINTGLDEYEAASLWFTGSTPNTNDKWGILRKPLPYGVEEYGELQVSGVCIARVNVLDANHTHAKPKDGETYLESAAEGPLAILDKPTGTGELECVVVFRPKKSSVVRFALAEPLLLGGEAAAYTVIWNGSAYATDTAITVKDFTATPGTWQGNTGFVGWATLPDDSDDGKYEIIWMETFARFIEGTLDEDMGYSVAGQASATLVAWYDIKQPLVLIVLDPAGLFKTAKSGAKFKAVYDPKRDAYVLTECETLAGYIEGSLTANVSSGSATASVARYGGTQQDIQSPGSTLTVYDPNGHFTRALSGAKYRAELDRETLKYNLVECQTKAGIIWGELTADMTAGSAAATIVGFGGAQQDVLDPGSSTTVYDPQGLFPYALDGAKFKAVYNSVDDKYYLVECQQMVKLITGEIPSSLSPCGLLMATASFTVDVADCLGATFSPFNQMPGTETITIHNKYGWSMAVGAEFDAKWHEGRTRWEMYQGDTRCEDPEDC